MSFLHSTTSIHPSSSTNPSSYLHVNSNGGVSTIGSSINSNSASMFGSIGTGKHWSTNGQPSSPSSQQILMKQSSLSNNQQMSTIHFDNLFSVASSQASIEKKFELQQEDFPPLPHRNTFAESTGNVQPTYQSQISTSNHQTNGYNSSQHLQAQSPISFKTSNDTLNAFINRHQPPINNKTSTLSNSTTITTSGTTTSMPTPSTSFTTATAITDQYGLLGLLQIIHQTENNPDSSMSLNFDLTTLGLSMDSPNDLHSTFVSPFSDNQARAHEIDYQVPIEYQMGMQIREKLPPLNFSALNEDTLFFLFYLLANDYVQLSAATELHKRDWRYHKDERLWLTRINNVMPDQKSDTYEIGAYCVFDVHLWRKKHTKMRIDYDKLDDLKMATALKYQPDLVSSKYLQQQYTPVTSYNTNSTR